MAARIAHLLVVALLILNAASCAETKKEATEANRPETEASQASLTAPTRPKPFFLQFYTPPQLEIEAKVPQYTLPLKPDEIANWTEASKHFKCKGTAELILKNGFAVEEGWGEQLGLIEDAYDKLPRGVPKVVTVDTVLHIQHVLYDQLFKEIEQVYSLNDLAAITARGLAYFDRAYTARQRAAGVSTKGTTAVRRNVAYFAVAARLLDLAVELPSYVENDVRQELVNIERGAIGRTPIFLYRIDYSQFKPRGHYAHDAALQRYFRAMTWYAQGAFLFQGGPRMIVDAGTADIQTMQAIQIGRFLTEDKVAYAKWRRMHATIGFFAGAMDDVSVADMIRIKNALDAELVAAGISGDSMGEAAYLELIRKRLRALPAPRIHAATGLPVRDRAATPERKRAWLEQARGMRLFGPRFNLAAYAMSRLTGFPYTGTGDPTTLTGASMVPRRGYPSGLDLMALLGSERAETLLRRAGDAEYAFYDRELGRLRSEFGSLTDDEWHASASSARLNLIRMLLEPLPQGYPSAMRTPMWCDRTLSTGLAAWAQIEHDMALVHKRGYIMLTGMLEVSDLVEPYPAVYAEAKAMNHAALRGVHMIYPQPAHWVLTGFYIAHCVADPRHRWIELPPELALTQSRSAYEPLNLVPLMRFNAWLKRLKSISIKQLQTEPLDEWDKLFFGRLGEDMTNIMYGVERESKHPAVVADVFTEPNEGRVLEVATGRFNLLWVVYQLPSGEKVLGAGPVMSYYEFKQPMAARLTDEEWREMIEDPASLKLRRIHPPAWTKTFLVRQSADEQ